MPTYAKDTTVSTDKSRVDRERILERCEVSQEKMITEEQAAVKVSEIIASILSDHDSKYYLDCKYFRWGKLEKNIIDIINQIGEGEEIERLRKALELIRDEQQKHNGDWCRRIAEDAIGEKE